MSKARELAALGNAYSDGALSNRNLIINGAMQVAQRGTSATGAGYLIDRFSLGGGATTVTDVTQSQEALTSSDTPYAYGFRYAWKLLNNTATNNGNDYVEPTYKLENQDVHQSGWDATSSSSYATLSFWVKSSLAGTYYVRFFCTEGSSSGWKSYVEPFTVSANTWEKVNITLSGGSQSFPVTNEGDLRLNISVHYGPDYTTSSATTSAWHTFSGSAEYPDFSQNWKNTANATFYITGVQLEVGDTATPFEHRSYGDELARCQRYFQKLSTTNHQVMRGATGTTYGNADMQSTFHYLAPMRSTASLSNAAGGATVTADGRDSGYASVANYELTPSAIGTDGYRYIYQQAQNSSTVLPTSVLFLIVSDDLFVNAEL